MGRTISAYVEGPRHGRGGGQQDISATSKLGAKIGGCAWIPGISSPRVTASRTVCEVPDGLAELSISYTAIGETTGRRLSTAASASWT